MVEWGMVLIALAERINEIEEEDADFRNNKKWIKYRKQQDAIYEVIRKGNEREML